MLKTTPPATRNPPVTVADRKSTRLNSSHVENSYAVFCLIKKKLVQPEREGRQGLSERVHEARAHADPERQAGEKPNVRGRRDRSHEPALHLHRYARLLGR